MNTPECGEGKMNGLQTVRAKVRGFNPDSAELAYYPSLYERATTLRLTGQTELLGFKVGELKAGDALNVVIQGDKVLCAARPTKVFNIEGLRCVTGVIMDSDASAIEKSVRVKENGVEKFYPLNCLSECFQAQQDPTRRELIYNNLKSGDSVNLFVGENGCVCCPHVHYFSVNFR